METAGYAGCRLAKSAADDGDAVGAQRILDRAGRYLDRLPETSEGPRVQCLRARSALARLLGRPGEALAHARAAVRLGQAGGDSVSHYHLGAVNEVARALHDDGQIRGSLDVTRKLIATLERIGRGRTLAMVVEQYNQAALLSRLGEKRAAAAALDKAIDLASGLNPEQRLPIYMTLLVGELASDFVLPDSAIRTFRYALAQAAEREDEAYRVRALSGLAGALIDGGRAEAARRHLDELIRIVPEKLRWRAEALAARLMYAEGDRTEARRKYLQLLASRGFPGRGLSTPYFANMVLDASLMAARNGDPLAAESLAGHALRLAHGEGQHDSLSGTAGYARVVLARLRRARGNLSAARDELQRALTGLANGYGPSHPRALEAVALADTVGRMADASIASRASLSSPAKPDAAGAEPSSSHAEPSVPRRPGNPRSLEK
jgi:tetratricopeptide (TPR) repeat protein